MTPEQVGPALEALGKDWFVELATTMDGWCLQLIRRRGGYYAQTYNGSEVGGVVARAARGDRPDSRSR